MDSFFTECARVLNRKPATSIAIFARTYINKSVDIVVRLTEQSTPPKTPYFVEQPISAAEIYNNGSESCYTEAVKKLMHRLESGRAYE